MIKKILIQTTLVNSSAKRGIPLNNRHLQQICYIYPAGYVNKLYNQCMKF